jgi:2',3'-cyclic-nucleotide 2'-phosphodiesterase (5'-nucleotidase family)
LEEVRVPLTDSPRPARRGSLAFAIVAILALLVPAGVVAARPAAPVTIQILNVSDWHGNIDPQSANGGAWNISARWQQDRLAYPSLTLTAGDDIGASPPLSGFFNEEPAIRTERLMGIQVNTFGNHNFDKGVAHLQQMVDLAGAPTDAANPGAPFSYVASNLVNLDGNLTGVEPVAYFMVGGIKVAVIGIVNEDAPTLVSPGAFGTIQIVDGIGAAQQQALEAKKAGAQVVIVITHKGMASTDPPSGTLKDFADALPGGLIDVVIGDHTNVQYSGTTEAGILYHENISFGNGYARTLVTIRPGRGPGVVSKSVEFVTPGPAGALGPGNNCAGGTATFCDQAILDMLQPYRADLAEALDGVIGTTTQPFDRGGNIERRREMPIGDLIADSMREKYGVQIGYMTGGGIRSQFPACGYSPVDHTLDRANWNAAHDAVVACAGYASTAPYDLVIGDVYSVLTFGNNVLTRDVTGIKLWQALENGVSLCPTTIPVSGTCAGRFPQVSGIRFTFDKTLATGCTGNEIPANGPITWACVPSRVTDVEIEDGLGGWVDVPYDSTTYTMAITDFTNAGGDSYFMLADGQGTSRDRDSNVLLSYVQAHPNLDPTSYPLDRITICPCP